MTSTTNDKIAVTGSIALKGTLELEPVGTTFAAGNSYTIFTAASAAGNFDAISPATPGEGLKWNTSRITEGIISVDLADGIEDIEGNNVRVYPTIVKDYCVVEPGSLTGKIRIELIDQVGKTLVSDITSSNENYRFNISNLNSGFYFIRIITNNNQCYLRKVIKQ